MVEAVGVEPGNYIENMPLLIAGMQGLERSASLLNPLYRHCTASPRISRTANIHLRTLRSTKSILRFVSSISQLLLGRGKGISFFF